jgi:hypothetical protein
MSQAWLRDLGGADPYQLLGVSREATTDDVVRAHRQLIRDLHPDRGTGDAEPARLLNLARDVLLDPVRRAEYDALPDQPSRPTSPRSAWDAEDVVVGTEPPPSSAWETEDVVVGMEPPTAPSVPPYHQQPWQYQPGHHVPPYYQPYLVHPPRPRPSLGMPIMALVSSILCSPVGLILGILALRRHWHFRGTGFYLAIAAIVVSAAFVLMGCLINVI